jgi:hypothetical protein
VFWQSRGSQWAQHVLPRKTNNNEEVLMADATAQAVNSGAASGKRPGGLTALAVLNFVFGGLGVLALLTAFAAVAMVSKMAEGITAGSSSGVGVLYASIALGLVGVLLLIVSGIGYIGQKRFLGRTLGTVYGVVSLINTVLSIAMLHSGFGFGTIIGLVYPVLTLYLLNVTYKDNLVR